MIKVEVIKYQYQYQYHQSRGDDDNQVVPQYELEFSVDPTGMHHDLMVTLPLVVSCTNSANSGELASIEQTCTLHAHRE